MHICGSSRVQLYCVKFETLLEMTMPYTLLSFLIARVPLKNTAIYHVTVDGARIKISKTFV